MHVTMKIVSKKWNEKKNDDYLLDSMTMRSQHKQWFRFPTIKGIKPSSAQVLAKSVYLNDRPETEKGC